MFLHLNFNHVNFEINKKKHKLCFLIKGKWGVIKLSLHKLKIYFKTFNFFECLDKNTKIIIILLIKAFIGVNYFWYKKIELKGLGFKVYFLKNKNLFKIDLGYSHFFYYYAPFSLNALIKKYQGKKYIFIWSIFSDLVQNVSYKFLKLRKLHIYKPIGFKLINEIFRKKYGKNKQML